VGYSWGEIERMAQDPRHWRRKWSAAGERFRGWPMIGDVGGGSGAQLGRDRKDGPGSETLEEEVRRSWREIERMAHDWRRWRRKWSAAGER